MVLYEMLTGHAPFSGDTPQDVMSSILEKEQPMLTRYVPNVPAELQQIISKTLRKDRAQRYRDRARAASDVQTFSTQIGNRSGVETRCDSSFIAAPERAALAARRSSVVAALLLTLPFYRGAEADNEVQRRPRRASLCYRWKT